MISQLDINDQIDWLKSVKVDAMDTKSIIAASKLAREIEHKSGKVINLSQKDIIVHLGIAVFEINNKELNQNFSLFIENLSSQTNNKLDHKSKGIKG